MQKWPFRMPSFFSGDVFLPLQSINRIFDSLHSKDLTGGQSIIKLLMKSMNYNIQIEKHKGSSSLPAILRDQVHSWFHNKKHKTCARAFAAHAHTHLRLVRACACTDLYEKINLVVMSFLLSLSFKFRKDLCIRWGDIQLLVTMYISYYTLNFSQFSPDNFDFFWTPS